MITKVYRTAIADTGRGFAARKTLLILPPFRIGAIADQSKQYERSGRAQGCPC